jgi:hypothetical protein
MNSFSASLQAEEMQTKSQIDRPKIIDLGKVVVD